ncbi:hypothetical protein [Aliiroseovarius sediminis]|uniref:hypothetical protein n=1 Tax=Aliiroseovarius sediminis TaxID=2925839 RepID=UPI001F583226|nr:hypothetical protein [Aliiroseovarius sediminis]MCI2394594.1 hypothetical protein [Aliiroseovarius sediminis]
MTISEEKLIAEKELNCFRLFAALGPMIQALGHHKIDRLSSLNLGIIRGEGFVVA